MLATDMIGPYKKGPKEKRHETKKKEKKRTRGQKMTENVLLVELRSWNALVGSDIEVSL